MPACGTTLTTVNHDTNVPFLSSTPLQAAFSLTQVVSRDAKSVLVLLPPPLQAAFPLTQVVSRDPKGVFVLLNLLDLLSARIWDDPDNCEPGLAAIDSLCLQFCLSDKQLMHNAMHALSGRVEVKFCLFGFAGPCRGGGGGSGHRQPVPAVLFE